MHIIQSRRRFLASASLAAAAGVVGAGRSLADEGPPEVTTLRLPFNPNICLAPAYVADDLLHAEGFSDVQYVRNAGGFASPQMAARGEIDFAVSFAASVVFHLDAGVPVTALAGLHSGCYELFAREPLQTIADLKGKSVAIQSLSSSGHLYVSIMAKHVGVDPKQEIDWIVPSSGSAIELFAEGKTDAFLGFPPEPQELRARRIGRAILNTTTDKPWSQYICCILFGSRDFVRAHPIATKRAVRAILKTADICATEPETVARRLVNGGFTDRYDYALQALTEIPYNRWREFDPEDSMRFFALRLREVDMITSNPNTIIADGADWRFLNELKRELKA
jgi:NitT/TauT family transport system substrate-binding protein